MGKLLRILVVVLLLVSIVALVLAHTLFGRRELLKGRIVTLERGITRMARTIESASPQAPAVAPNYPEKDISPATAEPEPNPRRAQFWENYRPELESLDQPILDLASRRRDLMSYYRTDPVTGKMVLDPVTGAPIMDGPGTMQGVIDEVLSRAGEQYNLLTATRQQMRIVREELVETIREFNTLKNEVRTEKALRQAAESARAEFERQAEAARRDLQQANERVREFERRVSDLEQEKLVLIEEKDTEVLRSEELVSRVATLQAQIDDLRRIDGGRVVLDPGVGGVETGVARVDIGVGEKGTVVSVDQRYLFVVMELDEGFMAELVAAADNNRLPMVELLIERPGEEQSRFVTKVRLTQIKQDRNLAIGEIMADWQQKEIKVGDKVYYQ